MAVEDLIRNNIGAINGLVGGSYDRWRRAAIRARDNAYTANELYGDLVGQFVHQWDTWAEIMSFMVDRTPTVEIVGPAGGMAGRAGSTFVRQRLGNLDALGNPVTTANMNASDLEAFGGGVAPIPGAAITFAASGDFLGTVIVTVNDPVANAGTYRGLAMVQIGARPPEPLCWIAIEAT